MKVLHDSYFTEKQKEKILFQPNQELTDFTKLFDLNLIDLYSLSENQKMQKLNQLSKQITAENAETIYKQQAFLQSKAIREQFLILYLQKLPAEEIEKLKFQINDKEIEKEQGIKRKVYFTFFPKRKEEPKKENVYESTSITTTEQTLERNLLDPEVKTLLEQEEQQQNTTVRYQQTITKMNYEELITHRQKLLTKLRNRESELFPAIGELNKNIETISQVVVHMNKYRTIYESLKEQLYSLKQDRKDALNMVSPLLNEDQEYNNIKKELKYLGRVISKTRS